MPKRCFPVDATSNYLVELAWQHKWQQVEVKLNGRLIHTFQTAKELIQGREFELEDGRKLRVCLQNGQLQALLEDMVIPKSLLNTDVDIKRILRPIYVRSTFILIGFFFFFSITFPIEYHILYFPFSALITIFFNAVAIRQKSKLFHTFCIALIASQSLLLTLFSSGIYFLIPLGMAYLPFRLWASKKGYKAIDRARNIEASYAVLSSLNELGSKPPLR